MDIEFIDPVTVLLDLKYDIIKLRYEKRYWVTLSINKAHENQ